MQEEKLLQKNTENISEFTPFNHRSAYYWEIKKRSKKLRQEELKEIGKDDNRSIIAEDPVENTQDDITMQEIETGINMINRKKVKDKHIKLINQDTKYNVKEDLNNILANITIAQLLDASPKVRAELIKHLKLTKDEPTVNLIHKGKIAISKCKVYDVPSKVYLDYGAGINLISKSFLDKLPKKPKPLGIAYSSIVQVLSDVDQTPGLIYQLPLIIVSR